jgi:DNA-directed RNA polymerase subunit RPC12/RpoP
MNVAFACPRCQRGVRVEVSAGDAAIACPHCRQSITVPQGAFREGHLQRCLVCPSTDLFVRKDFPQRLGVSIVALGILASCITWAYALVVATFAVLFATALVDVVLYLLVPDVLSCYRCGALYRSTGGTGAHGPFNLETHERHRQQAARLAG